MSLSNLKLHAISPFPSIFKGPELQQKFHTSTSRFGMNKIDDWPEPITRVQTLTDLPRIPDRYIKPQPDRPDPPSAANTVNIPLIDLAGLTCEDDKIRVYTLNEISQACRDWGFFQVINHGVSPQLMERAREVWRQFFCEPMEIKEMYANSPKTYEGYGSRLGVEKGAILDWNDYYYLHYLPCSLMNPNLWPAQPPSLREVVDEYSRELLKLSGVLMKVLSMNLGLQEDYLENRFGGEDIGACSRVNFYPTCPEPDLTLGLSSHSDPGGITILLPDHHVTGLQVRKDDDTWVNVNPVAGAFIVNIGDQIQVVSNSRYKSVDHRVIVNSEKDRISIAFFCNPKGDLVIEPAKELVTEETPALYSPMSFDQYRLFIRLRGPNGKSHLKSLESSKGNLDKQMN